MADNKIQMPGAFGGLMRYDEEYKSRFMISPTQVVIAIIAIIVFVVILKLFFPSTPTSSTTIGQVPITPNGLTIPILI